MKNALIRESVMRDFRIKNFIPVSNKKSWMIRMLKSWELYVMLLPVVVYFFIFNYIPMYGVQLAFKQFMAAKGIMGSPWIGFENFDRFFRSYFFWRLMGNTIGISLYQLVLGFPIPIILAILMNEVKNKFFKKTVQLVTYAPHFISVVVVVGMLSVFLSPQTGIVNMVIKSMGYEPVQFMTDPRWFKSLYVLSGIWQHSGWSSIIYMAALSSIDVQQYEAAIVDGASKLKRIWHITLPGIIPTAVILFIFEMGRVMSVGFEKVYLMQNSLNMSASDVIATFVYRSGILEGEYGFSTAIGLFNNIINFIILILVNKLSKKLGETSLW